MFLCGEKRLLNYVRNDAVTTVLARRNIVRFNKNFYEILISPPCVYGKDTMKNREEKNLESFSFRGLI